MPPAIGGENLFVKSAAVQSPQVKNRTLETKGAAPGHSGPAASLFAKNRERMGQSQIKIKKSEGWATRLLVWD